MFLRSLLLAGGALLGLAAAPAAAGPPATTVYVVRHAEKDLTPGLADPPLTSAGEARARALARRLARRRPAALFTTDTRRTRATLAPLAQAAQLAPLVYDAKAPAALAGRIGQEFAGKTVVVVGHSNTILPLLAALGVAAPPVAEIGDNQYDLLFEVRQAGGNTTVQLRRYGKK